MSIHPTAIIDASVELGTDVEVGPYTIVKGRTTIGNGTKIGSHCVIGSDHGIVEMGENNIVFASAMIGGPPQDLKYKGDTTKLTIGDRNSFREFTTINIGTVSGGGVTTLGSDCLLMNYVHVAHDCHIGSNVIIANASNFAGHVTVEDHVRIGGFCVFNQFVRLGKYSFLGGDSSVNKDIMPFAIAQGRYAIARAANTIGLERAGFTKDGVESIYRAIRIITKGERTMEEAIAEIRASCRATDDIEYLVQFIQASERGVAR